MVALKGHLFWAYTFKLNIHEINDLKWAESNWSALAVHEWSGPLQFLWGVDGAIPRALWCMCCQPINSNRPFLVLLKAFGTGKWPIGSWYSVRHYGRRHCRVMLCYGATPDFEIQKNLRGISLSHWGKSTPTVRRASEKYNRAPFPGREESCLQPSAIEKR